MLMLRLLLYLKKVRFALLFRFLRRKGGTRFVHLPVLVPTNTHHVEEADAKFEKASLREIELIVRLLCLYMMLVNWMGLCFKFNFGNLHV